MFKLLTKKDTQELVIHFQTKSHFNEFIFDKLFFIKFLSVAQF